MASDGERLSERETRQRRATREGRRHDERRARKIGVWNDGISGVDETNQTMSIGILGKKRLVCSAALQVW
ncbi:hypothetical protein U1Q18_001599 [Sarracenia purpurea var. burkii]